MNEVLWKKTTTKDGDSNAQNSSAHRVRLQGLWVVNLFCQYGLLILQPLQPGQLFETANTNWCPSEVPTISHLDKRVVGSDPDPAQGTRGLRGPTQTQPGGTEGRGVPTQTQPGGTDPFHGNFRLRHNYSNSWLVLLAN